MVPRSPATGVWFGALLLAVGGCRRSTAAVPAASDAAPAAPSPAASLDPGGPPASPNGPKLAAIDMQVNVFSKPDPASPRYGYLRLGAIVDRDAQPSGNDHCPGGWYRVRPRGYVCANQEVTFDTNHELVRASPVRPDTTKPLPYKYAFASGAAPLYLRIPDSEEQKKAEYHLKYHEGWWSRHHEEVTRVAPGANDVPLDDRGVARTDAPAPIPGQKASTELSFGQLLGGTGDDDPVPFWLQDGRTIANVADYKPGPRAYFAKKIWRHTGVALIGAFATGPDSRNRHFALTVDLRLVPADRLKPETASAFHGVDLQADLTLPLAFVRDKCDPKNGEPCAHVYKITDEPHQLERTFPYRSVVRLSGKKVEVNDVLYYETKDGDYVRGRDAGVAVVPDSWPLAARTGQRWIEVSIRNQTLVLWEGQKPVYMTLVSTGQDGLKDPKTTKSTPMGYFRIQSKHVTATMDANEQSAQGKSPEGADKDIGEAKMIVRDDARASKGEAKSEPPRAEKKIEPASDKGERDPDEPKWGRPEGSFELRDVPYVQYFSSGYALHAAYWHDVFGTARSHGCINLSPIDAHRIFFWTDPPVPEGWHGAFTTKDGPKGSMVMVHE